MQESDLYPPVKRFLELQGYEVKGEVGDCDVFAVRGDEDPVVVELKLNFTLDVVLQAVDRLSVAPSVYVGIPKPRRLPRKRRARIIKLVKMLGLGLLIVDPALETGAVDVLVDPCEYKPRKSSQRRGRLLGEFLHRVGDPNLGGSAKRKGVMTAYRQRALAIGRFLEKSGPTKASAVAESLQEPKARDILYRDVYGWFERTSVGVYCLSPRGAEELPQWPS